MNTEVPLCAGPVCATMWSSKVVTQSHKKVRSADESGFPSTSMRMSTLVLLPHRRRPVGQRRQRNVGRVGGRHHRLGHSHEAAAFGAAGRPAGPRGAGRRHTLSAPPACFANWAWSHLLCCPACVCNVGTMRACRLVSALLKSMLAASQTFGTAAAAVAAAADQALQLAAAANDAGATGETRLAP